MAQTFEETIRLIFETRDSGSVGISDINDKLAGLATTALAAEAAMLLVAGAMAKQAYDAAVSYETALSSLDKVYDGSQEKLEQYAGAMDELAIQYGVNSEALVESLATFKQFGFDIETSSKLVKNALDVMIAGDLGAAEATNTLRAALTGFGVDSGEAAAFAQRFADIMNEVSNTSAVSFSELAEAVARVSPVAKQAGLSVEEITGLMTPAIEVFGSGAEVANAFRTGLLRLTDDSVPVQEALKTLGVAQRDYNNELRPVGDILKDVIAGFGALTEAEKLEVSAKLFGIEQTPKLTAAFRDQEKIARITATAMNAAGSATKEVGTRLETSAVQVKGSAEAWRQLARTIGNEFRDELTAVIAALGEVAQAFTEASKEGAFDDLYAAMREPLNNIEEGLRRIAENLPDALAKVDFTRLIASFKSLGEAAGGTIEAIFGADLTSAEGLARAIQNVANAVATLNEFVGGVIEGLKPFLTVLGEILSVVLSLEPETVAMGGAMAGFALGLKAVAGPIKTVYEGFKVLGKWIPTVATAVSRFLPFLLGPAGLGAAFGLVAFKMYEMAKESGEVNEAIDRAKSTTERYLIQLQQLNDRYDELLKVNKESVETEKDRTEQVKRLGESFFEQGKAYNAVTGEIRDLTEAELTAQRAGMEWYEALDYGAQRAAQAGEAADGYGQALRDAGILTDKYVVETDKAAKKTAEVAKEMTEAEKASEKFRIEMEKLASEERIAALEFSASIQVAELEADAQRVQAIMSGLETVFQSTGDVIADAFGVLALFAENEGVLFGAAGQVFDAAMKQIELENQLRQQAAEDAHRLAEAEIRLMEIRADRLASDAPLITIGLDGVEPELEAIMWKILERIQLRANEEGQPLLLGY